MRGSGAQGTDSGRGRERGQASVEFLGILPAALLAALAAWQLALAGESAWLAARAARSGARAQAVGMDPERAARSALPAQLRRGLHVEAAPGRPVRVRVRVPLALLGRRGPLSVGAEAGMDGP
jgi:pilus assembly protein CpaE